MEELEDEADDVPPGERALPVVERAQVTPEQPHAAGGRVSIPAARWRSVDFPDPLRPVMETVRLGRTTSEAPSSAVKLRAPGSG